MIKVFIFAFNRPDLLELQVDSLRKFNQNLLYITVVQDKHEDSYDEDFTTICEEIDVELVIHNAQSNRTASQYHADSVQFVYDNHLSDGDVVLFLDHDMFAIEEMNLLEMLGTHDVLGLYQERGPVKYIWPGMMLFKYDSVKNLQFSFSPGSYNGQLLDTGGGTYRLFGANLDIQDSGVEYPEFYNTLKLDDFEYPFELHLDNKFLHMRNSCQWNNNFVVTDHNKKTKLDVIMSEIL